LYRAFLDISANRCIIKIMRIVPFFTGYASSSAIQQEPLLQLTPSLTRPSTPSVIAFLNVIQQLHSMKAETRFLKKILK
ncbi:hypothetical protein, partial [Klebsiella oxytoca]|uniref:hypothetical protein n=1 Tax=Klebsiella oxytoca TaxID=571 RepID=UPI00387A330C